MKNELLQSLPKEKLIQLIEDYSKNWLAMDGVWFQSVEQKLGMDEAMYHDAEAWRRFSFGKMMGRHWFTGHGSAVYSVHANAKVCRSTPVNL